MRKKYFLLFLILSSLTPTFLNAQALLGNYNYENTINIVRDNPAFAYTDDRAQINIFSVGMLCGGNTLLFKPSIFGFLENGNVTPNTDYEKNGSAGVKNLWGNLEIAGPGASFKFRKKHNFAITTGARYLINSNNLDRGTFMLLGANAPHDSLIRDTFNVNNFRYTSQFFKEINLSYATYIYSSEDYNLIGGVTLKVLFGAGAMGVNVSNANFNTYNNDGTAYNLSGNGNFVYTPFANKWALSNSPLNALASPTNNMGIGADVGMVYYINVNETMALIKGYQLRLAASVTDIGSINYTAGSFSGNFNINNQNINYKNIQNNSTKTFGTRLFSDYYQDTVLKGKSNISKFTVGLPTALRLNADIKVLEEKVFFNINGIINLRNPNADKYVNHYITTATFTPRYATKLFQFALPFTFNNQKQGYLGGVIYCGPFYIGSSSIFSMTVTNKFNNIDLFSGLSLRIKKRTAKERDYMMM